MTKELYVTRDTKTGAWQVAQFDSEHGERVIVAGLPENTCRLFAAAPELLKFSQTISRMKQDGEEDENGNEWIMENDDAVITLNELICGARELVAKAEGRA